MSVERRLQLLQRQLPGDERALRQVRRQQGLPHAANRACPEHGLNPLDDHRQFDAGLARDYQQRIALKALNAVFGDRENARIDRVTQFDGNRVQIHNHPKTE